MNKKLLVVAVFALLSSAGCRRTWVDDDKNFQRIFSFEKPADIQVLHSYYQEERSWLGSTYKYHFIAYRKLNGKVHIERWNFRDFLRSEAPDAHSRYGCGPNPPSWFVSKSPEHYEMWVAKDWAGIRVFSDKDDDTTYSCAGRGSS